MKKVLKKYYKFIIGIIIGLIISSIGAYAATGVASAAITYDNTTSGLTSTNLQGAIDEVYEKIKPCKVTGGTGKDIGDEITCGTEVFYVGIVNENNIVAIAKYNLEIGSNIYSTNDYGGTAEDDIIMSGVQKSYCVGDGTFTYHNKTYIATCATNGILMGADSYKKYLTENIGMATNTEVKYADREILNAFGCDSEGCLNTTYDFIKHGEYWINEKGEYCLKYVMSDGSYGCITAMRTIRVVVTIQNQDIKF